ncbi:ORC-CDC6 family AAA ATPase [Mucilaginibacter gotjawali]|nr:AarF/UbiB family protein [Mucilaginibacter gotjawali]
MKIIKSLARGFYGATYVGEFSPFGKLKVKKVIKIIPVALYKLLNKDFKLECENHLELAQNSNHVVNIDPNIYHDDIEVTFTNGITIHCHVIGLEYLDGITLKDFLLQDEIPARTIAQISIDLITLLQELRNNEKYHNDLHPGNVMIEKLPSSRTRLGEIDENVRVVAIDLGSVDQKTKSHDDSDRVGDLHWIAQCLNMLSRRITDNPDKYDEKDWRLAFLLEEKADFLKPEIIHQKQITYKDLINQIKDTFYQHTNPWQAELKLKSFDDAVNAQSLSPWFISSLFVDKDDTWTSSISIKGPQVIAGMRGCGKTMLLRALEFHARLMPQNTEETNDSTKVINRLKSEGYIGLYVSCVKLLDFNALDGNEYKEIFEPYSKLLIGYAIQSVHVIRHLRDLKGDTVRKDYFVHIASVLSHLISNSAELNDVTSDYDLETKLKKYLNSLNDGQTEYKVTIHPKIAFPQLAEAIRKASEIFANSNIFFLLDDVSTRYLNDGNIIKLVSELLFQDETCAFKFTTEAQTLEMVIMAPGSQSQAKIGRDYSIFDLGAEVNKIIHEDHHEGQAFIENILLKRARYFPLHPKNLTPSEILGDASLISVAEDIVREAKASEKKGIYHGISALTAVCVGDLGDVIALYELILRKGIEAKKFPIDAKTQNACYLELCNSRLYDLNRRDTRYLDFVEGFANASHHLLVQSAIRKAKGEVERFRQYTSIFINITHGDTENQYRQVRQLIDAGIFNLQGGPEASRTNRQGLKPQQQFKLIFRKLYGVSKHMGLSSADRFEISGPALEEWLNNPKKGKEILIKNLNPIADDQMDELIRETALPEEPGKTDGSDNQQLFLFGSDLQEEPVNKVLPDYEFTFSKLPAIAEVDNSAYFELKIDVAIIGLGFEEATLQAAKKVKLLQPEKVIFIKFSEEGYSGEIMEEFSYLCDDQKVITESNTFKDHLALLEGKMVLIDITGLPKAVIFDAIKNSYLKNGRFCFSLMNPAQEYPLDEEVQPILDVNNMNDSSILLNDMSGIVKGETGPYALINLLPHYTNISDPRVLFSFASAKHERLYTLIAERDYEKINVVVSNGDTAREKLSRISAEFSLRQFNSAVIHYTNQNNLDETLTQLAKDYYAYFILNNLHFEIALTGSKIQSAAVAIFSSVFKISQCWYVRPASWDTKRFSIGYSDFKIFAVTQKNGTSKPNPLNN